MGVDLTDFPQGLADQLGIDLFAGQILAACIMLALLLFPTLFLTKKFNFPTITALIMGMLGLGFCVAVGWLPIWLFTVICMVIALMFSKQVIGIFQRGS